MAILMGSEPIDGLREIIAEQNYKLEEYRKALHTISEMPCTINLLGESGCASCIAKEALKEDSKS